MNSVLRGVLASALLTTVLPAAVLAADLTVGLTADPSTSTRWRARSCRRTSCTTISTIRWCAQRGSDVFGPGLAESWENVDDTTWRFKLRDGVTFHNGNAFTAEDVVYTVERRARRSGRIWCQHRVGDSGG